MVSGDKLLETGTSKPSAQSHVHSLNQSTREADEHQPDGTILKICPLCITLVNLWGPRNITSLLSRETVKEEVGMQFAFPVFTTFF